MAENRSEKFDSITEQIREEKANKKAPIKFQLQLNEEQKAAKEIILNTTVSILSGQAGSGKTLLACNVALDMLFKKQVKKIVVTRPTVSREEIGFLPGDLKDKMQPWMQPIYSNFYQLYNKDKIDGIIKDETVEIVPVAFMRGRAQPLHSKVLTPEGWKEMGSLQVGEEVIGRNGKPCKITGVFPQGTEQVYKISFTDGSSVLASGNHLWEVTDTNKPLIKSKIVKSTLELKEQIFQPGTNKKKWSLPMVEAVDFKEKQLTLSPYLLGLLLGDGCIRAGISFCSADTELIDKVQELLPEGTVIKKRVGSLYDYGIGKVVRSSHAKNNLYNLLDELELIGTSSLTKFIPGVYLLGSIQQRLDLLRGLMDTDGSIFSGGAHTKRKTSSVAHYYTISDKLAEGVKFLVESLGGTVKVSLNKIAGTVDKYGRNYNHDCYNLSIRMPEAFNPFSLERKASLFEVREKPSRRIVSIEEYSFEETQCISVSAEDSLYITDNCQVTHNTFLDSIVIVDEAQNCTNEQMSMIISRLGVRSKMIICGDTAQVDLKYKNESGFRFLLTVSKKVKDVETIMLKTNHRHPVVEAMLAQYEELFDVEETRKKSKELLHN